MFGKAKVTLQLLDYRNPAHKSLDGSCCEVGFGVCLLPCDNWFSICVKQVPMKHSPCIKTFKTKVLYENKDNFYFPGYEQSLGNRLTNPLKLTYDGPLVSIAFSSKALFRTRYNQTKLLSAS